MNKAFCLVLVCILAFSLTNCKTESDDALYQKLWVGTISAPNQAVRIFLAFKKASFGKTECRITVPQQGLVEIETSRCRFDNDSLHLEFLGRLSAHYDARLTREKISGKWSQGGHLFDLNLKESEGTIYQAYVEEALNFAKQSALDKNKIDWPKVSEKAIEMSKDARGFGQLTPTFQFILRSLSDKHGAFVYNGDWIGYETGGYEDVSAALKKAFYINGHEVVSTQLGDSIGYILIPRSPELQTGQDEKFNQKIQKHVCDLVAKNTIHWIVDLRLNSGGSMYPMLAGLNQLFGNNKIGAFVDNDGQGTDQWFIKNGDFYVDQDQKTASESKCNHQLKIGKIAVLTGSVTASSGEAVVIALRGLENSKIFGEPTRGFTTALQGMPVGDNTFFISTGYYADAKGRVYDGAIIPDVKVKRGDNFDEIFKDKKVLAAMKWMEE